MKRLKALALCCMVICLTMALAGCSSPQSYTPSQKSPTLSTPTIGKSDTLRVGVNADSAPLAGSSTSSKIVGIDVDIAASLADSLGLKLEIVDIGTNPEDALKNKKVDIVLGVDQSEEKTFWKSEPYLSTGVTLFAAASNTTVPTEAAAPKIAAQVSSKSSWQVTNQFGDDALVPENDLKSAFSDIGTGVAQYAAADAIRGTYAANTGGYEVHAVALMQQPSGYCVGVLDANTELKQAVSDAVSALAGGGVVSVIKTKWLGSTLDVAKLPLTEGAKTATSTTEAADNSGKPASTSPGGVDKEA